MLDDQVWRQVPCDIINNPKIRSIAKRFNPMYRQAVFAFYVSIYMEADEDGIVDLSDIEVYADQLMIDDEDIITDLIDRFSQKGYITQLKDGRFFIDDFTNPNQFTQYSNGKKVYETADKRRERILNTINGKKAKKTPVPKVEKDSEVENYPQFEVEEVRETESYPQVAAENVENEKKFVVSATHSLKSSHSIKKEINKDINKDTHTQETEIAREEKKENKDKYAEAEQEEYEVNPEIAETGTGTEELAGQAIGEEETDIADSSFQLQQEVLDDKSSQNNWTLQDSQRAQRELNIPDNVAARLIALRSQNDWKTAAVLYSFFKRHDGFISGEDVQFTVLQQLIIDIGQFSEPKNPPHIIAGQLCTQYENLVNQRGAFQKGYDYFKGMVITPKLMRSPSVWPRIVAEVKKTLSPGKTSETNWAKVLDGWASEMRHEQTIYGDPQFFDKEMQKKGINPSEKGAMMAFLTKIASEQRLMKRE